MNSDLVDEHWPPATLHADVAVFAYAMQQAVLADAQGRRMNDIPWREEAVAVREPDRGRRGERVIVAEGSLGEVIDALSASPTILCPTLCVSILNRRVPPFQFEAREVAKLIKKRRRLRHADL